MEDYIMKLVVFGVVSWTTGFLVIRRVLPNKSFEFCNRIVSTIHAISAVILASLSVQDWTSPVSPSASKSSPIQERRDMVNCLHKESRVTKRLKESDLIRDSIQEICQLEFDIIFIPLLICGGVVMTTIGMSLAYMIYDLICCLLDKHVKLDNSIHHLVSIVGLAAGLSYQMCGSEMVAALWVTELSSPFLHLRELLKECGYKDSDLNLAADISFAVIFTIARMIGGPYITYVTLSANNPFLIKAMALGLQLVSAFWFYRIARMVKYKLIKRTTTSTTSKKVS